MKQLFVVLLIAGFVPFIALAQDDDVVVGDKAPSFKGIDENGNTWDSDDHYGKNILVIYFYPAAMTGGCTKQACAYRDKSSELKDLGVEVIGVSGDEYENLKYFKEAENLNFSLISDPDGTIANKFDVPRRSGGEIVRTVNGQEVTLTRKTTMARWTYVVGKDQEIIYKEKNVNPQQDVENVIQAVNDHRN